MEVDGERLMESGAGGRKTSEWEWGIREAISHVYLSVI